MSIRSNIQAISLSLVGSLVPFCATGFMSELDPKPTLAQAQRPCYISFRVG